MLVWLRFEFRLTVNSYSHLVDRIGRFWADGEGYKPVLIDKPVLNPDYVDIHLLRGERGN